MKGVNQYTTIGLVHLLYSCSSTDCNNLATIIDRSQTVEQIMTTLHSTLRQPTDTTVLTSYGSLAWHGIQLAYDDTLGVSLYTKTKWKRDLDYDENALLRQQCIGYRITKKTPDGLIVCVEWSGKDDPYDDIW